MLSFKNFILSKYFWLFAIAAHVIVLLVLYLKCGINLSNESEKYLAIANRLNSDNYKEALHYLWAYSFYILYLAVCCKIGFSLYVILGLQYLMSLTGFYLFYKFILSQSFFSKAYARICLLTIITCPVIIYWQLTFYTETFFMALVMMSVYCVFKPQVNYVMIGILIPALLFCRPVGVFYVIAMIFILMKRNEFKIAGIFLYSAFAFVFCVVLFYLPVHYNDFALPIFQGSVICGFPAYPSSILPEGNYSLAEIYSAFLKEHSMLTLLILELKKLTIFFTITRPYYSLGHNAASSIYYLFIIGGLLGIVDPLKRGSHRLFYGYFSGILVSSMLIVALIYNEWSERFMAPLLPFFILLTFIFIYRIRLGTAILVGEVAHEKAIITT